MKCEVAESCLSTVEMLFIAERQYAEHKMKMVQLWDRGMGVFSCMLIMLQILIC